MMNITPSSINQVNYSLKELQDIFSAMNSSIIVAITDRTGKITFVNDHFCKISKYTREELLGQDHRLLNSGFIQNLSSEKCGKQLVRGICGMARYVIAQRMAACIG
ncbi:PAS domain-containing protein [Lysinibacillus pakistanensis]|uniref:PAS domain S-box protein n=1 Tax=Lysinibacillus pakistanensis TaxID=759811 RepID=UPI003D2B46C9